MITYGSITGHHPSLLRMQVSLLNYMPPQDSPRHSYRNPFTEMGRKYCFIAITDRTNSLRVFFLVGSSLVWLLVRHDGRQTLFSTDHRTSQSGVSVRQVLFVRAGPDDQPRQRLRPLHRTGLFEHIR